MDKVDAIKHLTLKIVKYLRRYPAGGTLYAILDDGNIDNSNLSFDFMFSAEENGKAGHEIAQGLLSLNIVKRQKVIKDAKKILAIEDQERAEMEAILERRKGKRGSLKTSPEFELPRLRC